MFNINEIVSTTSVSNNQLKRKKSLTSSDSDSISSTKRLCSQHPLTDVLITGYQRISWNALKEMIKEQMRELNQSNIRQIAGKLFKLNIIRARGLLADAIIRSQIKRSSKTHVYTSFVALINEKLPQIGALILKRILQQYRQSHLSNDTRTCISMIQFLSNLINKNLLHEIVGLQILVFLFENPTDDNIMLSIELMKQCYQKLLNTSPQEFAYAISFLRKLLDNGSVNQHTRDVINDFLVTQTDTSVEHLSVPYDHQYKHILSLDRSYDLEMNLNEFQYDHEYEINEKKYKQIRNRILEDYNDYDDDDDDDYFSSDSSDTDDDEEQQQLPKIIDQTESDLVKLHQKICLTIQTNIDAKRCANKLIKLNSHYRQERELCKMIIDMCLEQLTYDDFFGLLGEHLCLLREGYNFWFHAALRDQYSYIVWVTNVKLKNLAKFCAHLLATNSILWSLFASVNLTPRNTLPEQRFYMKNLLLELFQFLGFTELKSRLTDSVSTCFLQNSCICANPENIRFCINFFTEIGLGRITDELQELLITNFPSTSS